MNDEQLREHYLKFGRSEGRRSHAIADRLQFASLPLDSDALELRPFNAPLRRGERVSYFDILDHRGLIARAQALGKPADGVPETVQFVSAAGDLGVIDRNFDAVLSAHIIERQPDLLRHLQAVERLLRPGGLYLTLVFDKHYGSHHFLATSTIADVLDAYYAERTTHTLRALIEDAALTTRTRASQHWLGRHGVRPRVAERALEALERYQSQPDLELDLLDWYFTPTSFQEVVTLLGELGHTRLRVARLYPALKNSDEFWAVLEYSAT